MAKKLFIKLWPKTVHKASEGIRIYLAQFVGTVHYSNQDMLQEWPEAAVTGTWVFLFTFL